MNMSNGFFGGVKALVSYFSSAERMTTSLAQSSPAPQISKIRLQSYLQKRASENFGSLVFFQKLIIFPFRVSVRVSKQWVELVCTYGFPHSLSDWFNGSNVSKTQFSFVTHLRQQNQSPSLLRWTRPSLLLQALSQLYIKMESGRWRKQEGHAHQVWLDCLGEAEEVSRALRQHHSPALWLRK